MDSLIETYVSVDPQIHHGKPCFRGTRIPVYVVLELLESGLTPTARRARCSAAVQLEAIMRTVLSALVSPGAWLLDSWPALLTGASLALVAASLAFLLRRQIG